MGSWGLRINGGYLVTLTTKTGTLDGDSVEDNDDKKEISRQTHPAKVYNPKQKQFPTFESELHMEEHVYLIIFKIISISLCFSINIHKGNLITPTTISPWIYKNKSSSRELLDGDSLPIHMVPLVLLLDRNLKYGRCRMYLLLSRAWDRMKEGSGKRRRETRKTSGEIGCNLL